MASFNVTTLQDFGYNETTHFIDPMEPQYRARPISGDVTTRSGDFSDASITDKFNFFMGLDAYSKVAEVEKNLDKYWSTHTTLATKVKRTAAPTPEPTAA